MGRRPTKNQWIIIALMAALVSAIAGYLWKRRSQGRS